MQAFGSASCFATLVAPSLLTRQLARTMLSFGVYNCGASSANSFSSKKAQPSFRRKLLHDVETMAAQGASVVFMQELHPEVSVFLPPGWKEVYEDGAEGNCLRVWFKTGELDLLAATQEKVFRQISKVKGSWCV